MTSKPQMPDSADASFTQPLWQGLGLLFSFIPNQPLARQAKSLELFMPSCMPWAWTKVLPSAPSPHNYLRTFIIQHFLFDTYPEHCRRIRYSFLFCHPYSVICLLSYVFCLYTSPFTKIKGAYTESFGISPEMVQILGCSLSHWSIKAA